MRKNPTSHVNSFYFILGSPEISAVPYFSFLKIFGGEVINISLFLPYEVGCGRLSSAEKERYLTIHEHSPGEDFCPRYMKISSSP